MSKLSAGQDESRFILVSAYLSGDDQRRKREYFERLDASLRKHNVRLHLLNLSPKRIDSQIPQSSVPYFVPYARLFDWAVPRLRRPVPERLREAVVVDSEDLGNRPDLSFRRMLFFRAFIRKMHGKQRPSLCILWHQFNGIHHALSGLLEEQDIPFCYGEYGQLPGTISFDRKGQMAESSVSDSGASAPSFSPSDETTERVGRYLDLIRSENRTHRAQSTDENVVDLIRRLKSEGKSVFFYAGENGYRTGMLPSQLPRAKVHSPYFKDTAEALGRLAEVAEKNDWHVIFKPHPLATDPAAVPEAPNRCVTVVADANVFDCMRECDVTVTILSQVSYLAVLHDRPVVLLGRSPISGTGCAYEIDSADEVESVLDTALKSGLSELQKQQYDKHVQHFCSEYLYAMDPDVEEILGRGPDDAARILLSWIEEHEAAAEDLESSTSSKGWGADSSVAAWGGVRLPFAILSFFAPLVNVLVRATPRSIKDVVGRKHRWF